MITTFKGKVTELEININKHIMNDIDEFNAIYDKMNISNNINKYWIN